MIEVPTTVPPPRWYLDTSAALTLIFEEPESAALAELVAGQEAELVGSRLLETELRRSIQRVSGVSQETVSALLEGVNVYEMTSALFRQAGLLPGARLRSLDALQLSSALALDVDALLTYDVRLQAACRDVGVRVLAPS